MKMTSNVRINMIKDSFFNKSINKINFLFNLTSNEHLNLK